MDWSVIFEYYYDFESSKTNTFLNNDQPVYCRICGKRYKKEAFTQQIDVLPACIGNRSLYTYLECDFCNQKLGRTSEDSLGKFLSVFRSLSFTKKRHGYPKHKLSDQNESYIVPNADKGIIEIVIKHGDDSIAYNVDVESKTSTILYRLGRVNLVHVCKTLLHSAILSVNEEHYTHLKEYCDWLDGSREYLPIFYWGLIPFHIEKVSFRISHKKLDDNSDHYWIVLGFSNVLLALPLPNDYNQRNESLDFPPIPPDHDILMMIKYTCLKDEKTPSHVDSITLQFDNGNLVESKEDGTEDFNTITFAKLLREIKTQDLRQYRRIEKIKINH